MIVSRGRGYVFVHIPKTGGTSLALALEARAMADDILIGDTPKARRRKGRLKGVQTAGRLWKHATLSDAEGLISRQEMAALYTVTLVRNPWDRLVSYYHWLKEQTFSHPAVTLARTADFATFLGDSTTARAVSAAPYGSYMRDGAGTEHCNLYIRLENFTEDSKPFEKHLKLRLDLPHANPSGRVRDYRAYYSDALAENVARICAEDIARFNYTYG